MEANGEKDMTTNFHLAYSPTVVFFPNPHPTFGGYVDDFFNMARSIYLDPHDNVRHLEHHSQPSVELRYFPWRVNTSTWTWDPSLWMSSLDYFSIVVSTLHMGHWLLQHCGEHSYMKPRFMVELLGPLQCGG
jgi:hypothetical protein